MSELPNQPPPPVWLRCLPGLALFRTYRREWLRADALAGISVCVVMIPSVIAYAGLLGLPPQHGLYAALVPLLVYPFFGSSRPAVMARARRRWLRWWPHWAACCCSWALARRSAPSPTSSPSPSWSVT
jgi:hypothetical protein